MRSTIPLAVLGFSLALAAVTVAQDAPPAPVMQRGEEVDVVEVEVPRVAVAEKAFPVWVTLENKMNEDVELNLATTFYATSDEKDYPCGNQGDEHYRGAPYKSIGGLTLRAGDVVTYPVEDATPWWQVVKADWVDPGTHRYELCVFAVEPGYKNVTPVYRDLHSVHMDVRSANQPPEATFSWSPLKGNATHPVTFTAEASDPEEDALTHRWDFGHLSATGRATATGRTATHAFYPSGTYTVTLTVSDGFDTTTVEREVEILPEAVPAVHGDAPGKDGWPVPGPGLAALVVSAFVAGTAARFSRRR